MTWIPNRNGLRFAKNSTVLSSRPLRLPGSENAPDASLEMWVQPDRLWDSGTLLAFYSPDNLLQFSLRQDQTDLLLKAEGKDEQPPRPHKLRVKGIFRRLPPSYLKAEPSFITITTAERGISIYLDGAFAATEPRFRLSRRDFDGQFVVGDSPGQPDDWKGKLFGLAIYDRQLTPPEISRNYAGWKQNGRPEPLKDAHNLALYLFDARRGNVVRDETQSGVDLNIPEKYEVEQKIALEPFWSEFSMTRSYWSSVLKNIVGFIPFGISFCCYFSVVRPVKRSTLLTVALGLCVSLTIEILQAFLPNRDSGTTDLFTNTLGTWLGAASYRAVTPAVAWVFPWLRPFVPRS